MIKLIKTSKIPDGKKVIDDVPSLYKVYNSPEQRIAWRSLYFSEVLELSSINRLDALSVLSVYKNAVELIDGEFEDITLFDFLFTQIYIDLETIQGSVQSFTVECSCGNKSAHEIRPVDLDFTDFSSDFPLYLEVSDKKYVVDVFRVRDLPVRQRLIAKGVSPVIATFACVLRDFDDINEAVDFVNSLDYESGQALQSIEIAYSHGIKPIKKVCPHCEKEMQVEVDAEVVDFLPFRGLNEFIGNKVFTNK